MKKAIGFILGLAMMCTSFAFGKNNSPNKRPVLAVSFNAVKEIVTAVGGEYVDIVSIMPENRDAHHYEPRGKEIKNITRADLLFIIGLEMEEWVEGLVDNGIINASKVVTLSDGLSLLPAAKNEDVHKPDKANHHHGDSDYDPHVWLGLTETAVMADTTAAALSKIDPAHAACYAANARQFSESLLTLRDAYRAEVAKKHDKAIVVGHEAFAYLCRDLGLAQQGVRNAFNDGEPSAKKLAELVNYVKANHVTVIFSEEKASPAVSRTLARETGTRVETLYTMETKEDGLSLLERQKANLEKILNSLD